MSGCVVKCVSQESFNLSSRHNAAFCTLESWISEELGLKDFRCYSKFFKLIPIDRKFDSLLIWTIFRRNNRVKEQKLSRNFP